MIAKLLICIVGLLSSIGVMASPANADPYSPAADENCFSSIGANDQGRSPSTASDSSEIERGILAALPVQQHHPQAPRLRER